MDAVPEYVAWSQRFAELVQAHTRYRDWSCAKAHLRQPYKLLV